MTCNDLRQHLYKMDQGEELSATAQAHLAECPSCRRILERLEKAETELTISEEFDPLLVNRIMESLSHASSRRSREGGILAVWILGGFTLLGAVILVRYSLTFHYLLESQLGRLVDLGVTVALGIFLVSYLAAFILGNASRLSGLGEAKKKAGL